MLLFGEMGSLRLLNMTIKNCPRCKIDRNINEFSYNGYNNNNERVKKSYCKECEKNYRANPLTYIRNKYNRAVSRYRETKLEKHKVHFTQKEFIDEVLKLLSDNNNLCPIKKEKIVFGPAGNNSLSVDRIDPLIGYKKNNIMITSKKWNVQKSDNTLYDMLCFAKVIKKIQPEFFNKTLRKVNESHDGKFEKITCEKEHD